MDGKNLNFTYRNNHSEEQKNKSKECDRLFVYGTLQHRQSRNYILKELTFQKAILSGYRKISLSHLGFPIIIPDKKSKVKGEVYFGLDNSLFQEIDVIEGEGSLYHRFLVNVETLEGESLLAYVYCPSQSLIDSHLK